MDLHRRQFRPDLPPAHARDPRFADNRGRCAHVAELDAVIAGWTRARSAQEAEDALEAAEVPASRLFDVADCAADPHFRARGAVQPVDDPLIGPTLHTGPAIRFDGDDPAAVVAWPGPAVGADTDYVMREILGL
jgi:formyl-CoA transferase